MILPDKKDAVINFCLTHAATWNNVAAQIGLDPNDVTELQTLSSTAFTQRQSATTAKDAYRSAVILQDDKIQQMRTKCANMIKTVRIFAANSADPAQVYADADLPLPSSGDDLPPPPPPSDVTARLNNNGSVTVKWDIPSKGAFRGKTVYIVQRSLTSTISGTTTATPFESVGVSTDREFVDVEVPTGQSRATYRIIASRNGENSDTSMEAAINFGVNGSLPVGDAIAEAA